MGKRRAPRVAEQVSARIFGLDKNGRPFSVPVKTIDVSHSGARLSGEAPVGTGETIGLEVNGRKGRFLVVWVGRKGSKSEGQLGLKNLDPKTVIWGVSTPEAGVDKYHPPRIHSVGNTSEILSFLEYRDDRRVVKRLPVRAGVKIKVEDQTVTQWGICRDISSGGCYVETTSPLPVGAKIEMVLYIDEREIRPNGVVRSSKSGWGMGIQFSKMNSTDKQALDQVLEVHSKSAAGKSGFAR
jgi:type IV pilus assembly protein PilZ